MSQLAVENYKQLLRASGLVQDEQLSKAFNQLKQQAPHRAIDSNVLAQQLLETNVITQWQQSKLSKGCSKGFFIGKYKLLAHLGTGGMSRVYLAVHTMMKRQVAIKVLNQKLTESESHLQRFLRESQAAAALDHPNVVRAFDVDCEKNLYYFVMEYVEGPTLQQLVERKGPLPYEFAADYMRQAAEGLQHAHDNRLVHRDIKPGNLLVSQAGVVKVLDLGMVRLSSEEVKSITIQFNESMLGTADYLSPEQALDSHNVDHRADIYSLGCTFYFILTGHPPFAEGSMAMRLMRHQSEEPPAVTKDRPDAPDDLIGICMKMMAKTPEERYQNCSELANDLQAWLNLRRGTTSGRPIPLPAYPPKTQQEEDTVANAGPSTEVNKPVAAPTAAPAPVAAAAAPVAAAPAAAAKASTRPADYNQWKLADFESALLSGDPQMVPAVSALCQKYPSSDKVVAFLAKLITLPQVATQQLNPQSLGVLLQGLGVMNTPIATKTLMRVVVGSINLGVNDRTAVKYALQSLAEYASPEREKFLVEVLANAEDARPAGKSTISPNELRMAVAKTLLGKLSPRLKTELQSRLGFRSLAPEAHKLIQQLISRAPAAQ